jgi:hypothetical protein
MYILTVTSLNGDDILGQLRTAPACAHLSCGGCRAEGQVPAGVHSCGELCDRAVAS